MTDTEDRDKIVTEAEQVMKKLTTTTFAGAVKMSFADLGKLVLAFHILKRDLTEAEEWKEMHYYDSMGEDA